MANPYKTDKQIDKEYATTRAQVEAKAKADKLAQENEIKARSSGNRRNAYSSFMLNKKELPEQLAGMGISGGATETSLLKANTNYENNLGSINKQEASDINAVNKAYTDYMRDYDISTTEAKRKEKEAARINRAQWEEAQQDKKENRYAKTISGWDSISAINKQIRKIRKSGKDTWRIAYLRARRAELREAGGGSGGGGGGSSRRYSYSGGGNNKVVNNNKKNKSKSGKGILAYKATSGKNGVGQKYAILKAKGLIK